MPGFGQSVGLDKGYNAEDVIAKYRAVKYGATAEGVLPITAAADRVMGISLFHVTAAERLRGKGASVRRAGIAEWECGGTITRGDLVTNDSVGRCVSVAAEVRAFLNTGVVGNNNAITWTAVEPGTDGNAITVTLTNAGATKPLLVDVANNGLDINVQLATDGSSVITSTAQNVLDALQDDAAASALITAANTGASTGAGLVVAVAKTNLATGGGTSHDRICGEADQSGVLGNIIAVRLALPGTLT